MGYSRSSFGTPCSVFYALSSSHTWLLACRYLRRYLQNINQPIRIILTLLGILVSLAAQLPILCCESLSGLSDSSQPGTDAARLIQEKRKGFLS